MKYLITLALVFFSGCSTCERVIGVQYETHTKVVEIVYLNSPAKAAGIIPGDVLISVNDNSVVISRQGVIMDIKINRVCLESIREEWK